MDINPIPKLLIFLIILNNTNEESIENLLDKNIDLGDYVGIRFLGISLGNSKINDKKNIDSEIKAKNVYVGIMPFRSFLKQKWIVKIRPEQSEINIERDFFNRDKPFKKFRSKDKSKLKYELNFNFNNYSILNLKKLGLETKVKGSVIYKSNNREIIANIKSNFDGKGLLEFKLNTKLNKDFLPEKILAKYVPIAPTGLAIDMSLSFNITIILVFEAPALFMAS